MKIAIHAKELENPRIDGTRSYMSALLHQWSDISEHDFLLYHGTGDFDDAYHVPQNSNMNDRRVGGAPLWTQTRFAHALWRDEPDVLWMPLHNLPRVRRDTLKTVVTIHDLAFKVFPETFPASDRRKHDVQTAYACTHADKIIAVSHATRSDILEHFPQTNPDKIHVVHHGVDPQKWGDIGTNQASVLRKYNLVKPYMVFVGGVQPRKNLVRLLRAFEIVRDRGHDLQLVIVGGDAWLAQETRHAFSHSAHAADIIMTGLVPHDEVVALLRGAMMSIYISLYEGFGMPILEAFASDTPVLTGRHSSLVEVAGSGAHFCHVEDVEDIAHGMITLAQDERYARDLVEKGRTRLDAFTWDQCADKTLAICTEL